MFDDQWHFMNTGQSNGTQEGRKPPSRLGLVRLGFSAAPEW